jgi:hypothetical protein
MKFIPHFDEVEFNPINLENVDFENQKMYLYLYIEIQRFYKNIWSINHLLKLYKTIN